MNDPFIYAHTKKVALSHEAERRLAKMYSEAADDIRGLISNAPNTKSSVIMEPYLKRLLHHIKGVLDKIAHKQVTDIGDFMYEAGKLAITAGNELLFGDKIMQEVDLFGWIPKQQVENIISGGIYSSDWTLSKAIWGNNVKKQAILEDIVARGLAEGRSIQEIAQGLEMFVDPAAKKIWNMKRVSPKYYQKMEYNAQRLARTMIQHAFQSSMVQQQHLNPFCKGIRWHSAQIHGRTCDICRERNEKIFPVEALPLDHPNGLCWFEPVTELDNSRMKAWLYGGDDPAIDQYVSRGLDYDGYSAMAKAEIDRIKKKYHNS